MTPQGESEKQQAMKEREIYYLNDNPKTSSKCTTDALNISCG